MVYEWCKPFLLFVLTLAVFGFPTAKKDQDFEVGLVFGQQETKGDNKFEVNWLLWKSIQKAKGNNKYPGLVE